MDFFIQRRRWAPSTLANIIDLVSSWMTTVHTNDNISSLFMFYQFILLSSSLLGPALVTLMIAGSYSAVFHISQWNGLLMAIAPVVLYIIICLKTKNQTQIMVAGLLSSAYSVVMVVVTVGTLLNALDEPLYSPNVILPMTLGFIFISAGVLHPKEFVNLIYGVLYYLTVPSTFVFLTVYYLCNLHNVSWGTREVPLSTDDDENAEKKANKRSKGGILTKFFQKTGLSKFSRDIRALLKRALNMEKSESDSDRSKSSTTANHEAPMLPVRVLPEMNSDELETIEIPAPVEPAIQEEGNAWTTLKYLGNKAFRETDGKETVFWKYIIDKYLRPIEHNEKQKEIISNELVTLRNNVVFGFFLLNLLFTILVFQLQINKESLRKFFLLGEYEPVSLAFLCVFALIILTQFVGMVVHRWGTYQHLIASTKIGIFSKHAADSTYAELALKEAGKLQSANSDIIQNTGTPEDSVSLELDYPAEDYDDDDELPPDYDSHSPDYSEDENVDIPIQNAYARNFRERFHTRQLLFSQEHGRSSRRPTGHVTTHDLYNRTIRDNAVHRSNRRGVTFEDYRFPGIHPFTRTRHDTYGRHVQII